MRQEPGMMVLTLKVLTVDTMNSRPLRSHAVLEVLILAWILKLVGQTEPANWSRIYVPIGN